MTLEIGPEAKHRDLLRQHQLIRPEGGRDGMHYVTGPVIYYSKYHLGKNFLSDLNGSR